MKIMIFRGTLKINLKIYKTIYILAYQIARQIRFQTNHQAAAVRSLSRRQPCRNEFHRQKSIFSFREFSAKAA
jgi:hypothetical protein